MFLHHITRLGILLLGLMLWSPCGWTAWYEYSPNQADYETPAEQVVAAYQAQLNSLSTVVPISQLKAHSYKSRRFSAAEREAYVEYQTVAPAYTFWDSVVELKKAIVALEPISVAQAEAERLSERIVTTLYELAPRYRTFLSPYIHNLAIKTGLRHRGYCYHYVSDLFKALHPEPLRYYELRWAGSHKGSVRESNALAITKKGAPFKSGIIVDAWRTGGRPYWHAIAGDRYEWVEDKDYYITP